MMNAVWLSLALWFLQRFCIGMTIPTNHQQPRWDTNIGGNFASSVVRRFDLSSKDLVVDIGSNVGVLLGAFKASDVRIMGVDPAANIVMIARERGIDTLCDFFNTEAVDLIKAENGQAAVITATNVFAHVDDLTTFMGNVKSLLKPDGVFIFEAPYLVHLLEKNEIRHYLSRASLPIYQSNH